MVREPIVEQLRTYFALRTDIVAAWLFGSVARGKARANSDIDVGVILAAGPPRLLSDFERVAEIQDDLEGATGRKVDLVPMNGAAPDLLQRIFRDGVLLHESDHDRRVQFEIQARNEYWDLLPILERYRRTVLRRA